MKNPITTKNLIRLAVPGAALLAMPAWADFQWQRVMTTTWSGVKALAVAPSAPNLMLGGDGSSIYRSVNGGTAWSNVYFGFAAYSLAFDPSNPNVAYAGQFGYEVLKTTDGGDNWFELASIGASTHRAIVVDPTNPNIVYVGIQDGWGVYKSLNGGATWANPLSNADVQALAINPASPSVIFAGTKDYYTQRGGVLRSQDGGATWISVWPNSQINALAVDPTDSQVIYAGAEAGGVFKSTDGGAHWLPAGTVLTNLPVSALIVDPNAPATVYAATEGAGVYSSPDGGGTWTSINTGLSDLNCLCLALNPSSGALYAGTYSGKVFMGTPIIGLGDALDATNLVWTSGGAVPWRGETNTSYDGVDAAQSGAIANSQESWVSTTVIGPGTLSFWWKVSSELNYDFLEFYLDGSLQPGRISGEVDWQQRVAAIGAGSHVLKWRYSKDSIGSAGQDAAWLDQVVFAATNTVSPTLALNMYAGLTITGQVGATYQIQYATSLTGPTNWVPLTNLTLASSPYLFFDATSTSRPRSFYRAVIYP